MCLTTFAWETMLVPTACDNININPSMNYNLLESDSIINKLLIYLLLLNCHATGPERKSAVIEAKNRELVAYHEGGHALVALYTPEALPIHKATIVPRGQALGMVCASTMYSFESFCLTKQTLFRCPKMLDVGLNSGCTAL